MALIVKSISTQSVSILPVSIRVLHVSSSTRDLGATVPSFNLEMWLRFRDCSNHISIRESGEEIFQHLRKVFLYNMERFPSGFFVIKPFPFHLHLVLSRFLIVTQVQEFFRDVILKTLDSFSVSAMTYRNTGGFKDVMDDKLWM